MHTTGIEYEARTRRETVLPPLPLPSAADEANHRIANTLQLVCSLISIEARDVSDATTRSVLERTQQRISAIAHVHHHLYAARDHAAIDLGSYLEELGAQMARSCAPHRQVFVNADTVPVSGATASSMGILVAELVTNACKHAYSADAPGSIGVALHRSNDGTYRLLVEDRGRGTRGASVQDGLGRRLIDATVARLGGCAVWEDAEPGTRFRMDVRLQSTGGTAAHC